MSSSEPWQAIEIRTTPDDVTALRRASRRMGLSGEDYLKFLSQFCATALELRARKGPHGEPFRL
jgi:hypothetical protein